MELEQTQEFKDPVTNFDEEALQSIQDVESDRVADISFRQTHANAPFQMETEEPQIFSSWGKNVQWASLGPKQHIEALNQRLYPKLVLNKDELLQTDPVIQEAIKNLATSTANPKAKEEAMKAFIKRISDVFYLPEDVQYSETLAIANAYILKTSHHRINSSLEQHHILPVRAFHMDDETIQQTLSFAPISQTVADQRKNIMLKNQKDQVLQRKIDLDDMFLAPQITLLETTELAYAIICYHIQNITAKLIPFARIPNTAYVKLLLLYYDPQNKLRLYCTESDGQIKGGALKVEKQIAAQYVYRMMSENPDANDQQFFNELQHTVGNVVDKAQLEHHKKQNAPENQQEANFVVKLNAKSKIKRDNNPYSAGQFWKRCVHAFVLLGRVHQSAKHHRYMLYKQKQKASELCGSYQSLLSSASLHQPKAREQYDMLTSFVRNDNNDLFDIKKFIHENDPVLFPSYDLINTEIDYNEVFGFENEAFRSGIKELYQDYNSTSNELKVIVVQTWVCLGERSVLPQLQRIYAVCNNYKHHKSQPNYYTKMFQLFHQVDQKLFDDIAEAYFQYDQDPSIYQRIQYSAYFVKIVGITDMPIQREQVAAYVSACNYQVAKKAFDNLQTAADKYSQEIETATQTHLSVQQYAQLQKEGKEAAIKESLQRSAATTNKVRTMQGFFDNKNMRDKQDKQKIEIQQSISKNIENAAQKMMQQNKQNAEASLQNPQNTIFQDQKLPAISRVAADKNNPYRKKTGKQRGGSDESEDSMDSMYAGIEGNNAAKSLRKKSVKSGS